MSYVIATLVTRYELDANAEVFGALCCALTAGPCFVASVFFYLGGIEYEKIMIEKDKKTAEALEKAEKEQVRGHKEVDIDQEEAQTLQC
jgi:hypothetical protein